jgi:hypothetical protein
VFVSVALIAGVAAAALLLREDAPLRVAALEPLPPVTPDLSDPGTRIHLSWLARYARSEHLRANDALYYQCRPGLDDSYTVHWSYPDRYNGYVEIRRDAGGPGATALSWPDAETLPPPPPPPPGYTPPASAAPAQPPVRHAVSESDFKAVEGEFIALAQDRIDPIRSRVAIDGGGVVLEFCRGGRYGVFVRMNHVSEPDDRRVFALGRKMLALTGIGKDKVGSDDTVTDTAGQ